jgi:hypothetical protein
VVCICRENARKQAAKEIFRMVTKVKEKKGKNEKRDGRSKKEHD